MKVHILTIGDEILIGQIIDTNSAWMGQQLNLSGAEVVQVSSLQDTEESILEGLKSATANADVILMTGGLGPTKDDITKKVIAKFFGVGMTFSEPTWERITKLFERWGRSTTEQHRMQCYMPENAEILTNKMGTAPGMWMEENGRVYVSMPGVPYEMKYLMEYEILPKLRTSFPGEPIAHRTILTIGEGESRLAEKMGDFEESLPPNIKLAFLPGLGAVRLRLTGRGGNEEELNALLDAKKAEIEALLPEFIFGYERETIEEKVGHLLLERGLTLGTAESCTGGLIAHKLTTIPGSSAYYLGSIVAYANEVKMEQLGVKSETLAAHGAVSEQIVTEMVAGARKALGVDIAVSISGIAGPGGGTEEKPVGTVWIAVGNAEKTVTKKWQIGKNRLKNIEYSSVQALNLVRQFLLNIDKE